MGENLVLDMAERWSPEKVVDEFRMKIEQLVEAKEKADDVQTLKGIVEDEIMPASTEVIDLTELLRRSLRKEPTQVEKEKQPAKARAHATAANDDAAPLKKAAARKSRGEATVTVKPTRRKSG